MENICTNIDPFAYDIGIGSDSSVSFSRHKAVHPHMHGLSNRSALDVIFCKDIESFIGTSLSRFSNIVSLIIAYDLLTYCILADEHKREPEIRSLWAILETLFISFIYRLFPCYMFF